MRHIQGMLFFLIAWAGCCHADGIVLPAGSYTLDQLEAAQTKAGESGQAITFLLTKKDSTCPPCIRASRLAIKELEATTIIVYASVSEWKQLPEKVREALQAKGHFIPKVAVTDRSIQNVLGAVSYEAMKQDGEEAFFEVKKAIQAYQGGWSGI